MKTSDGRSNGDGGGGDFLWNRIMRITKRNPNHYIILFNHDEEVLNDTYNRHSNFHGRYCDVTPEYNQKHNHQRNSVNTICDQKDVNDASSTLTTSTISSDEKVAQHQQCYSGDDTQTNVSVSSTDSTSSTRKSCSSSGSCRSLDELISSTDETNHSDTLIVENDCKTRRISVGSEEDGGLTVAYDLEPNVVKKDREGTITRTRRGPMTITSTKRATVSASLTDSFPFSASFRRQVQLVERTQVDSVFFPFLQESKESGHDTASTTSLDVEQPSATLQESFFYSSDFSEWDTDDFDDIKMSDSIESIIIDDANSFLTPVGEECETNCNKDENKSLHGDSCYIPAREDASLELNENFREMFVSSSCFYDDITAFNASVRTGSAIRDDFSGSKTAVKLRWSDECGLPLEQVRTVHFQQHSTCRIFVVLVNEPIETNEFLHCEFETQKRMRVIDLLQQLPKLRRQNQQLTKQKLAESSGGSTGHRITPQEVGEQNCNNSALDRLSYEESHVKHVDDCIASKADDPLDDDSHDFDGGDNVKYTTLCMLGKELINMLSLQDYFCNGADESKYLLRDGIIFFALRDGTGTPKNVFLRKAQLLFTNPALRRAIQATRMAGRSLLSLQASTSCGIKGDHNSSLLRVVEPSQKDIIDKHRNDGTVSLGEADTECLLECGRICNEAASFYNNSMLYHERSVMESMTQSTIVDVDELLDAVNISTLMEKPLMEQPNVDSGIVLMDISVEQDSYSASADPCRHNDDNRDNSNRGTEVYHKQEELEDTHATEKPFYTEGPVSLSLLSLSLDSSMDLLRISL